MFYEVKEIDELVQCPYCKNKYYDPRLVECGASFCMQCIDLLIKEGENGLKCPVCDDFHEKPKKGYSKNPTLAKLCGMQANEVSRGSLAATLKLQMHELKQNLDELAHKNKFCIERIKEHCDNLRNEVQLSSEELIETIKKHNMDLIDQINAYEKNSTHDFNQENKAKFDNFINDLYAFHTKWIENFKQFNLDDNELKSASTEACKFLEQIKIENEQVLDKVFNGNVLRFNKNSTETNSSMIGSLLKADMQHLNAKNLKNLKTDFFHKKI